MIWAGANQDDSQLWGTCGCQSPSSFRCAPQHQHLCPSLSSPQLSVQAVTEINFFGCWDGKRPGGWETLMRRRTSETPCLSCSSPRGIVCECGILVRLTALTHQVKNIARLDVCKVLMWDPRSCHSWHKSSALNTPGYQTYLYSTCLPTPFRVGQLDNICSYTKISSQEQPKEPDKKCGCALKSPRIQTWLSIHRDVPEKFWSLKAYWVTGLAFNCQDTVTRRLVGVPVLEADPFSTASCLVDSFENWLTEGI